MTVTGPLLFTPGPLCTSTLTKQAMSVDLGSRSPHFIQLVRSIRSRLLAGAEGAHEHECVLMQGSGTFGIEAVLSTFVPRAGAKVLVMVNGAYGERQVLMCKAMDIPCDVLRSPDNEPLRLEHLQQHLAASSTSPYYLVSMVHVETTAGVVNDVHAMGAWLREHCPGVKVMVDSMSAYGAYALDLRYFDYVVSSANKCLEGVPGFSFVLVRRALLDAVPQGQARSVALDLVAQWRGLEKDGQFRFTPPTHALLAFNQALSEWEGEGGVEGRRARYLVNTQVLVQGLTALGFKLYVQDPGARSHVITSFLQPQGKGWSFDCFYTALCDRGFVIYPGKVGQAETFRIGSIGRLGVRDCKALVKVVGEVLREQGVELS